MSLQGKKIVVTGASRGIGKAIVLLLAKQGASLIFSYANNKALAEQVLKEVQSISPNLEHSIFQLHLNNLNTIENQVAELKKQWPQIDGLVNNAGVTCDQIFPLMKEEDFVSVIQTNLLGTVFLTKQLLKPLMRSNQASIVNISSVIAHITQSGQSNYAASKAGLEAFSKSLATELGKKQLRVNSIAPGFIKTDMTNKLSEEQKTEILKQVPLKRYGDSIEVAQVVRFLLSSESSYITGQTLHVNGGIFG
ncbi:MAG: SDR family oxidoreductase [Bdellovibrionaceae bacterium]|nr:SDR family oxidoreductase [Pseudobdellovibrionaceae bacterium]